MRRIRLVCVLCLTLLLSACTILDAGRWPAGHNQIALTFDDGPNATDAISEQILNVLKKHGVRATFFYIGRNADRDSEIVRRAINEGHDIALHSYDRSFPYIWNSSGMREELEKSKMAIWGDTPSGSSDPVLYRPPKGIMTPAVRALFKSGEISIGYLSFYVHDAPVGPEQAEKFIEKLKRKIVSHQGGAIVIHESRFKRDLVKDNTVDKAWLPAALDDLISWAKVEGYEFVLYTDSP